MILLALLAAWLQAISIPAPTGLVNDFASVLSPEQEARIAEMAATVRTRTPGEIAVVTLADIGDRDPTEIALRIGREWGVGKVGEAGDPERKAGVVILLVPKETSSSGRGYCRVEVGTGAEGYITDATAGAICREATPAFAARDYGTGLELVTARVAERFANEFGYTDTTLARAVPRGVDVDIPWWLPFLIMFIVISVVRNIVRQRRRQIVLRRGSRRKRGRDDDDDFTFLPIPIFFPGGGRGGGWGGGGFGGGGFGGGGFGGFGGGGGFSGGGGGSSW